MDREQQFSCDLHGDGFDRKPSARAYTDTNTWYCFTCDRLRDPIQTVREKEGVDFWSAVKFLELKYKLPVLPWEQDQDFEKDIQKEILTTLHQAQEQTFEEVADRLSTMLTRISKGRELDLYQVTHLWSAYDLIKAQHEIGKMNDHQAIHQLLRLREKVITCLKGSETS